MVLLWCVEIPYTLVKSLPLNGGPLRYCTTKMCSLLGSGPRRSALTCPHGPSGNSVILSGSSCDIGCLQCRSLTLETSFHCFGYCGLDGPSVRVLLRDDVGPAVLVGMFLWG